MLKSIVPVSLRPKPKRKGSPRNKKERPKKTVRRREFSTTRLGWLILRESPVLYEMITSRKRLPTKDLIRSIALGSDEPYFKTDEFWTELAAYRPSSRFEPTAKEELERIRRSPLSVTAIRKLTSS